MPTPDVSVGMDIHNPALTMCRSVLEAMAEGVIVVREDGCLIAANESAAKLLELNESDLPCANFLERWPMARADGAPFTPEEHPFRVAFQDGAPRQSQLLGVTRPDGTRRWLSCGLYPVPPVAQEPRLLIAAFELLALQRQADIELRAVSDFSPVGVYLHDAAINCLYVNRRWEEITGMTFAETKTKNWLDLVHPDDLPASLAAFEVAMKEGKTYQHDLRLVRPDGQMVWVSARTGLVDIADGALTGYAGTLTDITERKQAEVALAAGEQRLRACIENTPYVAVQWFDAEGRVVYWNPASEHIFGWTSEEAMGRTVDQLMHTPEDAWAFLKEIRQVQGDGKAHGPAEYHFHRKDGSPGVCLSTLFPIPSENGQARFVCMDVDITARQEAENLVRGQEHLLDLISRGTPLREVLHEIVRFVEGNAPEMLCSILLLDPDGITLRHGAAPSLPEEYSRAIDGIRAGEGVGSCGTSAARGEAVIVYDIQADTLWQDYRALAAAHNLRACWSTPIRSAANILLGTFACYHRRPHAPSARERRLVEVATSVACTAIERARALSTLQATEQRFRLLVENSHDLVMELAVTGEIRYVSAHLCHHLGIVEKDLRATLLMQRVHPDDRILVGSALRQPHGLVVFRFWRKADEWLWFEAWGRRFTAPNGAQHGVIFARDVTERKATEVAQAHMENQLRQSHKMEAIGTLAGGVAHDFNNILAGILGHVELLRMDLPPGHAMQQPVEQIMKGTLRARDLVRQILTFSRGKETRRDPIRLSTTVEEALKLLRASLPSSIEFITDWPEDEPLIQADASQIHQIVMNVGLNAAQAIGNRPGKLEVIIATVELEESFTDGHPPLLPGLHVWLTMADTGCGMNAEVRRRIFDPFFTTKPAGQGTGLGLATVHGIVQMHQGVVTVASEPGAGASFEFFFRALEKPASGSPTDKLRLPLGNGQRILVVDDEEAVLWAAQNFLHRLNYQTEGFLRSPDALAAFAQAPQKYAAVLTDLTMPQIGGLDLARRLRLLRRDVPIVVMSGYLLAVEDSELREAGVLSVVVKPFGVQALAEALAKALPTEPTKAG